MRNTQRYFGAAFLLLFALVVAGCGVVNPRTPLPEPYPFDVSKKNSAVDADVELRTYRFYEFDISFEFSDHPSFERLYGLLRYGLQGRQGDSSAGVTVPIALRITSLGPEASGNTIFDEIVQTHRISRHTFCSAPKTCGVIWRRVAMVALRPGRYRIQAGTVQDTPAFSGVPTFLQVTYNPKFSPIDEIKHRQ